MAELLPNKDLNSNPSTAKNEKPNPPSIKEGTEAFKPSRPHNAVFPEEGRQEINVDGVPARRCTFTYLSPGHTRIRHHKALCPVFTPEAGFTTLHMPCTCLEQVPSSTQFSEHT
jgi:hypothetical protein